MLLTTSYSLPFGSAACWNKLPVSHDSSENQEPRLTPRCFLYWNIRRASTGVFDESVSAGATPSTLEPPNLLSSLLKIWVSGSTYFVHGLQWMRTGLARAVEIVGPCSPNPRRDLTPTMAPKLRISAGPDVENLETLKVNHDLEPCIVDTEHFRGRIAVRIKDFEGATPDDKPASKTAAYFQEPYGNSMTYSIQVQGAFHLLMQANFPME